MNDVVLGKAEIIERAVARVYDTYAKHQANLAANYDAQDIIVLNLQRACEAAIDMAMHLIRLKQLGLPKDSRDAFTLIERAGLVDPALTDKMRRMVGFRNVAVHDYRSIDWTIVRHIIERDLADLLLFSAQVVRGFGSDPAA